MKKANLPLQSKDIPESYRLAKIKQIVVNIDNKAFIIISNAREIWGKGFKKEKLN